MNGWNLCNKCFAWNIENGDSVRLWDNSWIPNLPPLKTLIHGPLNANEDHMLVRNILVNQEWNLDKLSFSIPSDIQNAIQSIHISSSTLAKDKAYWKPTNNGIFNLKSAIIILTPPKDPPMNTSWIWNLKIPRKICFFLWLCYHRKLPTRTYLLHIDLNIDDICPACRRNKEDIYHIFLTCPIAKKFWDDLGTSPHPQQIFTGWIPLDSWIPQYRSKP